MADRNVVLSVLRQDHVEGSLIDTMSIKTDGVHYEKNGCEYVFCGAFDENEHPQTKHRIIISEHSVEMMTSGQLSYTIKYAEGEEIPFSYKTPYGEIAISIYTNSIVISRDREEIRVRIRFNTLLDGTDKPSKDNESVLYINIHKK